MMGVKDANYQLQSNWGQPDELSTDFDPTSPLPHTTPTLTPRHQPSSLYTMCLRVILRNITSVQDLGVLPYRHAKPILEECRIDQLITLEEASPHLLEYSEEIWKRNCLRDFIDLRRKYADQVVQAKEPRSWRKLYFRTKGEIEQAKVDVAKRIKDKYEQHRAEKEAKKLVVRDRPMMAKAARVGGRKFGVAVGGVSKGQNLLNKARSGSVAQAKLTAPRNGRSPFKTQGRSRVVGAEIAPEAAGVEVKQVRPMVAPRRVLGGSSEGLAKMREFSRPLPCETIASTAASYQCRTVPQRSDSDTAKTARHSTDDSTALPRLKPHQVASAPLLSSSSRDRPAPTQASDTSSKRKASPPPDIARTERRKLDFFGGGAARSSPSNAVASSSSPRRGGPLPSSPSAAVEVRDMKRAPSHSLTADTMSAKSGSSLTSPPASSPTPFFSSRVGGASGGGGGGGVRVVQAKRARMQNRAVEVGSSPRNSSPPSSASVQTLLSGREESEKRPTPTRRQSSTSSTMSISRTSPVKDARLARASPAALSSIFMPSSSFGTTHRNGPGNSSGRNGSGRS